MDAIGAATCGLLLIGMGHLETLCAERQRAERDEQVRLSKCEAKARQDTEDLLKRNEELAQATSQVQRQMEALAETEKSEPRR